MGHKGRWTVLLLGLALAGCAPAPAPAVGTSGYPYGMPRSTPYPSLGAAAGWGVLYPNGYGYANPLLDPGPAGAAAGY